MMYHEPPQYARFEYSTDGGKNKVGEDSLPKMPVWGEAGRRRVGVDDDDHDGAGYVAGDGKREKELEVEYEMREPMLRGERERDSVPAPAYAEMDAGVNGRHGVGGDLGYGGGYKPYGAGYTAYSPAGKGYI